MNKRKKKKAQEQLYRKQTLEQLNRLLKLNFHTA